MAISAQDFKYISDLVYKNAGIVLGSGKEYLVDLRLKHVVQKNSFEDIGSMVKKIRFQSFLNDIHQAIIDALTTNETSFFRDLHPFQTLQKSILPEIIKNNQNTRKLSIWCAACSSGQEPYTIAMILRDHFPSVVQNWDVKILATDLSDDVLSRARNGVYNKLEVNRGLPAVMLVKYFSKDCTSWTVKDDIKRLINFKKLNLIPPFAAMPQMDVIFMRNVLIYFDLKTKEQILSKVKRLMMPSSYFFLGSTESMLNVNNSFRRVEIDKTSCYQLASD